MNFEEKLEKEISRQLGELGLPQEDLFLVEQVKLILLTIAFQS